MLSALVHVLVLLSIHDINTVLPSYEVVVKVTGAWTSETFIVGTYCHGRSHFHTYCDAKSLIVAKT